MFYFLSYDNNCYYSKSELGCLWLTFLHNAWVQWNAQPLSCTLGKTLLIANHTAFSKSNVTYQQCCSRIVLAQTVRAEIPMISQLVGGGTRGWLNSEEQARFWCFQHQVGTDQVQLGTYPWIGCFQHQVGTPWCSRHWDIRTGYTATQCHFPPRLQLDTLLVRYLLHQSSDMH